MRSSSPFSRRRIGRSRAIAIAVVTLALSACAGVAYAAFTATTANTGNSVAAATSFQRCLVDEVKADNPAGYWRLNETSGNSFADSAGTNTGSFAGGYTLGQNGALADPTNKAPAFNGSTGYASVPDADALDTGDAFTYEAWVKRARTGVHELIVSKGTNAASLTFETDNKVYLYKANVSVVATSNLAITDTKWHHIAVTKSGGSVALYIDGVDRTGTVNNATMVNNASPFTIAHEPAYSDYLSGSMDEVAVYGTALSADRIRAHFNAGRCYRDEPRADGPTAVWRLGESSSSPLAFDGANANNGTPLNGPTFGAGSLLDTDSANGAASFDGVDDTISVPDAASLRPTGDIALEAWITPSSMGTGWQRIIGKGGAGSRNYSLWLNAGGYILFDQDTTGTSGSALSPANAIQAGKTYHLVGVSSGSTLTLYINGLAVATGTRSGTVRTSDAPLTLGRSAEATVDGYFKGTIDEAALYSGALSAARVRDHYVAGRSYRNVMLDSGPIDYWRFGESSGNVVANEVSGRNGVALAGSYTRNTAGNLAGDPNPATTFLASGTGYGAVGETASQRLTGNMTLETWFVPTVAPTDYTRILGKGDQNNQTYGLWMNSSRQLFFQQCTSACGTYRQAVAPTALTLGEWHHAVATVSGNTATLYVDGQAVQSATTAMTPASNTSVVSFANAGYYSNFTGRIDDSALYNRAFSAAEVATHYAAGIRQPR